MEIPRIFEIQSSGEFEQLALDTFACQYHEVSLYGEFCNHLGKNPSNVGQLSEIPFLPIEFFKTHKVLKLGASPATVFRSSGTTGSQRSQHFVADLELYRESFTRGFEYFYGPVTDYCILALLPSYQERQDASLIYMVSRLIGQSQHPKSGFITSDPSTLYKRLDTPGSNKTKVLLLGVSFALLDLSMSLPKNLGQVIVMETGGMKGRRKEMVREELHRVLCKGFGVSHIHSEYGMTELLSQAYSQGDGRFRCPPWMQVRLRDTEDPLAYLGYGRTGGVNIIDLANQHSCAFLATQDLGRLYPDGSFEILGRFDHSDIRGCNLMAL
jgi:hypothetical protein